MLPALFRAVFVDLRSRHTAVDPPGALTMWLSVCRHGTGGLLAGTYALLPGFEIGEANRALDQGRAREDDRIESDVGNGELAGEVLAAVVSAVVVDSRAASVALAVGRRPR